MEKRGETIAVEEERCCRVQEAQRLLEEQLPTASQEDRNSRRISRKVCGSFAEAPRKGCLVFAGNWPRGMGSPMEPKPTQSAAKHYLT